MKTQRRPVPNSAGPRPLAASDPAARRLVSVVLPVHNEEGNILELYQRIEKVFQTSQHEFEVIFVDDGSQDRSLEIMDDLAAKDPRVKYIALARNFGHQHALTAGLDFAKGDAIITMDSDLQHPPELIPELLTHWAAGYPVVYTIRRATEGIPFFKKVTASLFYWLMSLMSPLRIEPNSSDFRLIDRRVCAALQQNLERERFYRGMIPWVGFRQKAVEFSADARFSGNSSYTLRKMITFSLNGIISYSYMPLYILLGFSLLFIFACIVYGLFILYQKFISGQALPGQTAILLSILLIGTTQLLATCVVAVYAYKTYQESKARPLYVIDKTKGIDQ